MNRTSYTIEINAAQRDMLVAAMRAWVARGEGVADLEEAEMLRDMLADDLVPGDCVNGLSA